MNYSAAIVHELAMPDQINDALLIYTGYGASRFPRALTGQLKKQFGDKEGSAMRARILELLDELRDADIEETRSRRSVTERAVDQLRMAHPELTENGLKALAWTYSFGMR